MTHASRGPRPQSLIRRRWPVALGFAVASLLALPAHAQQLFMKATCNGQVLTAGESQAQNFEDYVEIASIHQDTSVAVSVTAGGVQSGPASVDALRVAKTTSTSSIGMISVMTRGLPCEEILLESWAFGGTSPRPVWKLELGDAYISERKEWHISPGDPPQETFEFFPARLRWTHYQADELGNTTPIDYGWNFLTNSPQ